MSTCPVCDGVGNHWAEARLFGDTEVSYDRCTRCACIWALDVSWLDRAYSSAIARHDIGLLDRCVALSHVSSSIIASERMKHGKFLDWAGGYGAFTRLMRDRGYDFVDNDPMAENIFAGEHRVQSVSGQRFDLVTAYEVIEHLTAPLDQLAEVASLSDRLLLTTQVLPDPPPAPGEWDYYALDTGQHVLFYSHVGLRTLASRLGFDGVVSGPLVHLMYRGAPPRRRTRPLIARHQIGYLAGLLISASQRRRSLLPHDAAALRGNHS